MKTGIVILGLFCLAAKTVAAELPTNASPNMIVTDGWVQAIRESDGIVYMGGIFTRAGEWSGGGVAIDGTTAGLIPGFPKINGGVSAAIPDGAGGFFVAGEFTKVGTTARSYIAHINAENQLDMNWNPAVTAVVRQLALHNGVLYFSGGPNSLPIEGRETRIGAIHASAGTLLPFSITISGYVNKIVAAPGRLYVGGLFQQGTTSGASNLAAYGTEGQLLSWNPQVNEEVRSLAVNDDTVYVGGLFTAVGSQPRAGLAAVSASTGALLPWNPGNIGSFGAIEVRDGVVYVAGSFTAIAGQPRLNFAAFDAASGDLLPLQAEATAYQVTSMAVSDDSIVFGGYPDFMYSFETSRLLTIIDRQTGALRPTNVRPNFTVHAAAASGSKFFIGGVFSMVQSQERIGALAFNAATGQLTPWNPTARTNVLAIAVAQDRVFIAGELNSIGGQPRKHIGAVDKQTGALIESWQADADFGVIDMEVYGDRLYVGGIFRHIGGASQTNIAALDVQTGAVLPWDPRLNQAMVRAVEIDNGILYIGGLFRSVNGLTRNRAAAFDLASGQVTDWDPNVTGLVEDIEVAGSTIFLAGRITRVGGVLRTNIAAVSLTGELLPWAPNVDRTIYDMSVAGGAVFITGEIEKVNGQARGRAAAVDANTGEVLPWDPALEFFGNCLTYAGGRLYLGGVFFSAFNETWLGAAAFDLETVTVTTPTLSPATVKLSQNGVLEFKFETDAMIVVIPQVSDDLINWADLPPVQAQGVGTIQDDSAGTRRASFYRLKLAQ